jgi:hypothetical protein
VVDEHPISAQQYCSNVADTGRIYIKGYLYPILHPKISKKDIFYPFLEQDILSISYPISFFQRSVPVIFGFRGKIFPLALPFLPFPCCAADISGY